MSIAAFLAWQQAVQRLDQVLVRTRADLDHHDAGRGMRDEDREEAVAVLGHGTNERLAFGGHVEQATPPPGPNGQFPRFYGKMLRIASRRRPSPPPTGADSYRGSPAESDVAPHSSNPTAVL